MYSLAAVLGIVLSLHPVAFASPLIQERQTTPTQKEPPDFRNGEEPYRITPPKDGDVDPNNIIGTWLYGYDGCKAKNSAFKGNIDEAYYDSWTMANTKGVVSGINWNEAAALEWLGPPGINQPKQSQIQNLFGNIATVIYSYKNPFQHYIRVRCDDPGKRCEKRPDKDPCDPNPPPQPTGSPKPTPIAYASNNGGDGYPMINFCQGFFDKRNLGNAIAYGTGQTGLEKLKLENFDNRAQTFFHELTHLDLAANSPSPNPRVLDLTIAIKYGETGRTLNFPAYGFLAPKILARYHDDVGLYVQTNADNLANFALAKYVMTKNGNVYTHLPLVHYQIDGPPWHDPPTLTGSIAEFVGRDGSVYLNITDSDVSALLNEFPHEFGMGCPATPNSLAPPPVNIDKLAPPSAYPSDYNAAVTSWLSELGASQGSSTQTAPSTPLTSEAPPATSTDQPQPTSSPPPARTCNLDCGLSEPPRGRPPICSCYCSDGKRWIMRNGSPPCK